MDLDFVSHKVGQNVVQPNPDKVAEIQNAKRLETKKQVRSFLGLVGFYRKYIANFEEIATPLTNLTTKGSPNHVVWEKQHQVAFDSLKSQIVKQPILHIPDFDLRFILQTDASDSGIGAVLLQEFHGQKFSIAYASKKLLPRERNYSVIERECLAIVWAVGNFRLTCMAKSLSWRQITSR